MNTYSINWRKPATPAIRPRTITVPCRKTDGRGFGVQKYGNVAAWNVPGGVAPNGVSATRYLRRTTPDVDQLSPLAAFLVANCPDCVAGNWPAFLHSRRVRCYNGKTLADILRERAAKPDSLGRYYANGVSYRDAATALQSVERVIATYEIEHQEARIEDWHFSIIGPDQSDEDYWNEEARRMVGSGSVRVEIGDAAFLVH